MEGAGPQMSMGDNLISLDCLSAGEGEREIERDSERESFSFL